MMDLSQEAVDFAGKCGGIMWCVAGLFVICALTVVLCRYLCTLIYIYELKHSRLDKVDKNGGSNNGIQ